MSYSKSKTSNTGGEEGHMALYFSAELNRPDVMQLDADKIQSPSMLLEFQN